MESMAEDKDARGKRAVGRKGVSTGGELDEEEIIGVAL